jgi:hypothetical protein
MKLAIASSACAVMLALEGVASAASPVFEQRFTTSRPGAATGMTSHIVFPDYNGKPKSIARLTIELPEGTRFDERAVPECAASDAELLSVGLSACPRDSEIGRGTSNVVTGFGPPTDPIPGDIHVFHGPGQVMNLGTPPGSDRVVVIGRGRIAGRRIVYTLISQSSPPYPGGPPDWRTSAKEVTLRLDSRSAGGHDFLVTPTSCPATRYWTFGLTLLYEDGSGDSATSPTPCRPTRAESEPRPALRLSVRPRHLRAGVRRRLQIRVGSRAAACRGEAVVRLGRLRARTDRSGRATLLVRLRRPGRHRLRATRHGCRSATATLRVLGGDSD